MALALAAVGVVGASTVAGLVATAEPSIASELRPALAHARASIPGARLEAMQALPADNLVAAGPFDCSIWALGSVPLPGYAIREGCERLPLPGYAIREGCERLVSFQVHAWTEPDPSRWSACEASYLGDRLGQPCAFTVWLESARGQMDGSSQWLSCSSCCPHTLTEGPSQCF